MKLQWISLSTLIVAGLVLEGIAYVAGRPAYCHSTGVDGAETTLAAARSRGGDKRSRSRETGRAHGPFRRCPGTQAGVQCRPGGRSRAVDRLSSMSDVPQRGRDGGTCSFADSNWATQGVRGLDSSPLPRYREAAQEAMALVADKRARHFWDGGGSLGKEYGKISPCRRIRNLPGTSISSLVARRNGPMRRLNPTSGCINSAGRKRATCSTEKSSAKRSSTGFPDSAQVAAEPISGASMPIRLFRSAKSGRRLPDGRC